MTGEMTKPMHYLKATHTLASLLHLFLPFALPAMAGDIDLLISFKNSLSNPDLLSNWHYANRVCDFHGVACKGGSVVTLTIRGLPLEVDFSSVTAHIFSLENLEVLSLHSTNLTGSISVHANCTTQLKKLDLSSNRIGGTVFDAVSLAASCTSLQSFNLSDNDIGLTYYNHSYPALHQLKILDLSYNKITRNEDVQWIFSKLELLNYLDLSNNNIKGTIPQITNCTLQFLDLSSNELSGTIPASTFSCCIKLTYLNISLNHFTGNAWLDIKACRLLTTLSLSNNNFSGEIPIIPLVVLPALQHLDMAFNNINGSLPKSISKLTSLEYLNLSANRFSGPIPSSLCTSNASILKVLYLQDNYFTGSIPNSLSNCTSLVSLDLSLNLLYGSIPGSLGSLSNLKDLMMWQNNFHGEIPAEFSTLKSLKNLLLDYNSLTGTIPDGLVNCTSLSWISLTSNQLSGSIPIWIGKLEKLSTLVLGNNSFTGPIPQGLGDCKSLIVLDLNNNQLDGFIPPSLSKQSGKIMVDKSAAGMLYIDLINTKNSRCHGADSHLEFDGIRMEDLMRLPSIRYCHFKGFYTHHTGQYSRNNMSLLFLDLSHNQLVGQIPTEISTMQYLYDLNLKHNQLSGPLPQELGTMSRLGLLDLSYNSFEGSIPSSFSGLSLAELDLSNNNLSGPIPGWGSLVTFPEEVFQNNSDLCGFPLPPCGGGSMSKEEVSQQSSTNRRSSRGWWIALGLLFSLFFIIGFVIGQFL